MNMVKIVCPKCGAEKKLSLVETSYAGPQRCWKCHELYTITIMNNQVRSCEPLSEEEYQRQEEAKKAREKLGNFRESAPEKPPLPEAAPEKFRTFVPPETSGQAEPGKAPAPKPAPDRFQTFIEPARLGEPEKPEKSKTPPDRFRTFIPPAT